MPYLYLSQFTHLRETETGYEYRTLLPNTEEMPLGNPYNDEYVLATWNGLGRVISLDLNSDISKYRDYINNHLISNSNLHSGTVPDLEFDRLTGMGRLLPNNNAETEDLERILKGMSTPTANGSEKYAHYTNQLDIDYIIDLIWPNGYADSALASFAEYIGLILNASPLDITTLININDLTATLLRDVTAAPQTFEEELYLLRLYQLKLTLIIKLSPLDLAKNSQYSDYKNKYIALFASIENRLIPQNLSVAQNYDFSDSFEVDALLAPWVYEQKDISTETQLTAEEIKARQQEVLILATELISKLETATEFNDDFFLSLAETGTQCRALSQQLGWQNRVELPVALGKRYFEVYANFTDTYFADSLAMRSFGNWIAQIFWGYSHGGDIDFLPFIIKPNDTYIEYSYLWFKSALNNDAANFNDPLFMEEFKLWVALEEASMKKDNPDHTALNSSLSVLLSEPRFLEQVPLWDFLIYQYPNYIPGIYDIYMNAYVQTDGLTDPDYLWNTIVKPAGTNNNIPSEYLNPRDIRSLQNEPRLEDIAFLKPDNNSHYFDSTSPLKSLLLKAISSGNEALVDKWMAEINDVYFVPKGEYIAYDYNQSREYPLWIAPTQITNTKHLVISGVEVQAHQVLSDYSQSAEVTDFREKQRKKYGIGVPLHFKNSHAHPETFLEAKFQGYGDNTTGFVVSTEQVIEMTNKAIEAIESPASPLYTHIQSKGYTEHAISEAIEMQHWFHEAAHLEDALENRLSNETYAYLVALNKSPLPLLLVAQYFDDVFTYENESYALKAIDNDESKGFVAQQAHGKGALAFFDMIYQRKYPENGKLIDLYRNNKEQFNEVMTWIISDVICKLEDSDLKQLAGSFATQYADDDRVEIKIIASVN